MPGRNGENQKLKLKSQAPTIQRGTRAIGRITRNRCRSQEKNYSDLAQANQNPCHLWTRAVAREFWEDTIYNARISSACREARHRNVFNDRDQNYSYAIGSPRYVKFAAEGEYGVNFQFGVKGTF